MRKLILSTLVFMMAIGVYSQEGAKLGLGLELGYVMVGMGDVNKWLADYEAAMKSDGFIPTSVTKLGSGYLVGIKGGYEVIENLTIGAKVGYLIVGEGKVTYTPVPGVTAKTTVNTNLIPVSIGGEYKFVSADKLSISGGLYLGYGLMSFTMKIDAPGLSAEMPASGGGLSIDLGFTGEYAFAESISLGLTLGYKSCTIPEIKATKDVPELGVRSGDAMLSFTDEKVKADFSGLNILLGVKIKF